MILDDNEEHNNLNPNYAIATMPKVILKNY
jgi:hypothetical protein